MSGITELHQIDLDNGQIARPRWSLDGRFLAVPTESGSIVILDGGTMQIFRTLGPHSAAVTAVGWNREGQFIVSGSIDRSIGVWEVKNGRRVGIVIGGHNEPLHSVEFTNEGAYAMTCSRDHVRALDGFCLESGWVREVEDELNSTYKEFTAASCSFNTTLLLALAARTGSLLLLTSLLTPDVLDQVPMKQPIRTLAWSQAETLLAAAAGQSIYIFRATTESFNGPPRQLTSDAYADALAFSSDGTLLASRDAQGLQVWDVKTGKLITKVDETKALPGRRPAPAITFHPSRPILATVTANGTGVRILDLSKLS
jgi:WD40 repeat protein